MIITRSENIIYKEEGDWNKNQQKNENETPSLITL